MTRIVSNVDGFTKDEVIGSACKSVRHRKKPGPGGRLHERAKPAYEQRRHAAQFQSTVLLLFTVGSITCVQL